MEPEFDPENQPESAEYDTTDLLRIKAHNSLKRYIGSRDHSEDELRLKLSQKYPSEIVEEMIQLANDKGWMSDPEELAQRTADRLLEKGKGSQYISDYLHSKGLPSVTIDPDLELKRASETAQNKFGDLKELNYDDRPKVHRFLENRGFCQDIINQVNFGK